jgi:hypothetical protein
MNSYPSLSDDGGDDESRSKYRHEQLPNKKITRETRQSDRRLSKHKFLEFLSSTVRPVRETPKSKKGEPRKKMAAPNPYFTITNSFTQADIGQREVVLVYSLSLAL